VEAHIYVHDLGEPDRTGIKFDHCTKLYKEMTRGFR
jgi:hypothetical protein